MKFLTFISILAVATFTLYNKCTAQYEGKAQLLLLLHLTYKCLSYHFNKYSLLQEVTISALLTTRTSIPMDVKHTAAAFVQQESVQLLPLHQIVPKIIGKHFGTGRIKLRNNVARPI